MIFTCMAGGDGPDPQDACRFVEGGLVNPQFLENLGYALSLRYLGLDLESP